VCAPAGLQVTFCRTQFQGSLPKGTLVGSNRLLALEKLFYATLTRHYGHIRDSSDPRDYQISDYLVRRPIPLKFDFVHEMPAVRDQGNGETCVAFATGYMRSYIRSRELNSKFIASPKFIYYEAKKGRHHSDNDGLELRQGLRVLRKLGVPPETDCPYDDANLDTPCVSPKAITDAAENKIQVYARLKTVYEIKQTLAYKVPVVIGVPVFDNWHYSEITGVIPMPIGTSKNHHAVCLCGYDDLKRWLIFENSWGLRWASQSLYRTGFGIIRYDYLQPFLDSGDADAWCSADFPTSKSTGQS